jgi:RNA polymerase sigma factor (sigma-70 family)
MPVVTVSTSSEEREAAFERTVIPETGRLYRLALAVVDDPGEAEDAVQETILTAWRRWSTLERLDNPSAYLTRVCVNQCIRQRRLLNRLPFWMHDPESIAASPQTSDMPEALLDVDRAYRHLSARQRAMITLHLRDGLTVDECAAILGCRPGTARSHLGRAVQKLRKECSRA